MIDQRGEGRKRGKESIDETETWRGKRKGWKETESEIYREFHIKCNILKRHISASSNARKFRKKAF